MAQDGLENSIMFKNANLEFRNSPLIWHLKNTFSFCTFSKSSLCCFSPKWRCRFGRCCWARSVWFRPWRSWDRRGGSVRCTDDEKSWKYRQKSAVKFHEKYQYENYSIHCYQSTHWVKCVLNIFNGDSVDEEMMGRMVKGCWTLWDCVHRSIVHRWQQVDVGSIQFH